SKEIIAKDTIISHLQSLLNEMQDSIFKKALEYRDSHITEVNSFEEFKNILENKGGFVSAHWDGTAETEEKIKELTKATIRCIPLSQKEELGNCILTGNTSKGRVFFAKSY